MKVTIGIPTYNQGAFIEEAVRSALAQTHADLEVIVADDASDDITEEILKPYLADARFVYKRNATNLGRVSNYRHLLYDLSTGDWYVNMDGDDFYIDRDFIKNAVELIDRHPETVAIFADCEKFEEGVDVKAVFRSGYVNGELINGLQFLTDVQSQKANPSHLATVYNRKQAMAIGFYSLNVMSTDFESLYRLALHGPFVYLKGVVGVWRIHAHNMNSVKTLNDCIQNINLTHSVAAYGAKQGIRLKEWKHGMQRILIASILLEAKRDRRLTYSFFKLFKLYPGATSRLLLNLPSILKHLKPQASHRPLRTCR